MERTSPERAEPSVRIGRRIYKRSKTCSMTIQVAYLPQPERGPPKGNPSDLRGH